MPGPQGSRTSLEVAEAVARVVAATKPLGADRYTRDAARGHVLAENVVSSVSLPPWDNSAMDGYAVRAADVGSVPVSLRVTATIAAGQFPAGPVRAGECMRIMTGAPVPDGADSVIRVEDTDGGVEQVEIRLNRDAGKNVRPAGEDVMKDREALPAGTLIGAAQLGVLAAIGAGEVSVIRAPRVGILASGDELVTPDRFDEVVAGRKIVSSNGITLRELVASAGGFPVDLGIAADTRESLREHLRRAATCDLLLTSGGISVGEFDYVREVVAEFGGDLDFWRVKMRPGAPIGFGTLGTVPWIGLPGNPVSTMVTFELFARPAIRKMRGLTDLHRAPVEVVLDEEVSVGVDLTHFLRAVVTHDAGNVAHARLTGPQSSGILRSMALANALVILPRGTMRAAAGSALRALPLGEFGAYGPTFAA